MNKIAAAVRSLVFSVVLLATSQATAGVVVYSPEQYPTAQGHYLALPPSYQSAQQPAAVAPPQYQNQYLMPSSPAPVAMAPSPQPQPQPQYQNQYLMPAQPPVSAYQSQDQYQNLSAQPQAASNPSRSTFDQLPRFANDHNLDPRYAPKPRVPELPSTSRLSLATETGAEFGLQLSSYRYQEHDVPDMEFMHETGPKFGLTLDGNKAYSNNWFIGGDIRAAYGQNEYNGSGTQSGLADWLFELRAIGGKDFICNNAFWNTVTFDLTPYVGVGFRYLYNDARGTSSTGAQGYERYSHYFYIPVGLTPRFRVTESSRVSLNLEYDQLLYGWQVSSLGDAVPGATDVTDAQRSGFGMRGSAMYEWISWSVGPFFNYWNINQSTTDCNNAGCGDEPHNQTIEYGIQGRYRF